MLPLVSLHPSKYAWVVDQAMTEADLCIETLAGCQIFIFLDMVKNVERHLIVAAPRRIAQTIFNDSRHDVRVFLEHLGRIDLEDSASVETGQVFDGVEIKVVGNREVQNLLIFQRSYGFLYGREKTSFNYIRRLVFDIFHVYLYLDSIERDTYLRLLYQEV